jgi:HSP20 family protein
MAKRIVHQFLAGPGPSGEMALGFAWAEPGWQPRVDIYEAADALFLTIEVPGVADDHASVHFVPGQNGAAPHLIIEGRRDAPAIPNSAGPARCLQVEIENGPFRREVRLPRDADGEAITASRQNGLLIVTIPRRNAAPLQNVKVTVS